MSIQLLDLPSELLLNILSYITNIREKIRLGSVNSTFYNLVTEACSLQNYKLVNHSDYMYESEYKKLDNTNQVINLHELLRIAPRLTHLVDKVYHFGYETPGTVNPYQESLPLIYAKYICIDLSRSYFFGRRYEKSFDSKANITLSNIPEVTILDIRADKEYNIQFSPLQKLKVFKFSLYITNEFSHSLSFPDRLFDQIIQNAPNLEELYFNSKHVHLCLRLSELLASLAVNCPNLRAIKMFFQISPFSRNAYNNFMPFKDEHKLLKLEYLDFRGVSMPITFWDKLLSLMPNLKFLAFDPPKDQRIKIVIFTNCRNVKYDMDRPFEIEEEFRIYNQRTYGFTGDRYL